MKNLIGWLIAIVFCGALLALGVTQEVPLGKAEGILKMTENGKPIPGAAVTFTLLGTPEYERPKARGVETDPDGTFRVRNLPAGDYEVEITAQRHHMKRRIVSVEEGKVARLDLAAEPNEPFLTLYASQKVFTPDEVPKVELHGFVPDEKVWIKVFRLDMESVAKAGGLQEAVSGMPEVDSEIQARLLKMGREVSNLGHEIKDRDAEGSFIENLQIGKQPEGIYFVTCASRNRRASVVLNVSRIALVTKSWSGHGLAYVTDLVSGKPLAGAQLLRAQSDRLVPVGKTGADGTFDLPATADRSNGAVFIARLGTSSALVGFFAGEGESSNVRITTYCERPAYRPGDEIHFKGIARRVAEDGFSLPGTGVARVTIKDPDNNDLETFVLPVNEHGTFHGSFRTPSEGTPGSYSIQVAAFGGKGSGYANVVAYRKPEYSIEVRSDQPHYVMGDRASATVECKYYFGGPVVGAKVKASVYRSPAFRYKDDEEGDETVESYGGGEYSQEIEAVTDANGRAKIDFDTRADNDPEVFTNDYIYTVSASVTEEGGKYFDGQGEVRVTRGDADLTLDVENPIVAPGETVTLLAKVTDPVDRTKPIGGQAVELAYGREEWTRNTSVFIPRGVLRGVSGPDGTVRFTTDATRNGSVAFRASARDAKGRLLVAEDWAYVEGSPALRDRDKGSLTVVLDKRRYDPGQEARVLIQTDLPGGSALVTVQADQVLWQQVVPLTGPSTLVHVPVDKRYAPNAYIGVVYVRDKKFLEANKRLLVDRTDRDLHIAVSSDHPVYLPGDTAEVTVRTTDADGKPVPAEVSVGVVDEGIYAIHEDETDLRAALYPRRGNLVSTSYSFADIYLDGGDKGSSKIPLRRRFQDTAAWKPEVWTGPTGEAKVKVPLPDNLTQWRVTAVGVSDATQVGMSRADFRARKELMVRLELPQYLVDGDQQRMAVVVTNDTGQDQDVKVEVESGSIGLGGPKTQTIRVPNGRPQTLEYQLQTRGPATASVTARAWVENGPSDGVQQSFAVEPHGRKVIDTQSGEFNDKAEAELKLLPTADPNYGELRVVVSPTLAGDLVRAADELIGFPYGCVEQTMSRFMPSLLVEKAVRDAGLRPPRKMADLPAIMRDSLARIDHMQHSDGGWGWWQYDASDPFMTALVLDGLDRARGSGHSIKAVNVKRALDWGVKRLQKPDLKEDRLRDRLYLAYALLRFGHREVAQDLAAWNLDKGMPADRGDDPKHPREGATVSELATAVLAYHEAGLKAAEDEALNRLRKTVRGSTGLAYWPSEEFSWGEESTAMALVAFETAAPKDPLVPGIVRYLMRARRGDAWVSTRDSAYALVGLTQYLAQTRELTEGKSTVTVQVNGEDVDTLTLDPQDLSTPRHTVRVLRPRLGSGPVRVTIRKDTPGVCYFTAELTTLDTAPELKAETTDPGLRVTRRYYALEAQRLENGTQRLLPTKQPVSQYRNGDLIRVELTIESDVPRNYVLIEEPTPSSARVQEREKLDFGEEWSYWYSDRVIRDDRIAFFARRLPKGVSKVTYTMRAEQPGVVRALPTTVRNMYDPARVASTDDGKIEVQK